VQRRSPDRPPTRSTPRASYIHLDLEPVGLYIRSRPAPLQVYAGLGGLGIGYNSDMRSLVGDSVLTAPMFNWGPIFGRFVQRALDDTWVEGVSPVLELTLPGKDRPIPSLLLLPHNSRGRELLRQAPTNGWARTMTR
jgi:hypothetical protein